MSAIVTIAALPAAALVLWALLRSSLGERLVAHPTGERWHERVTPTFGGVGIAAGVAVGVGAALAVGALEQSSELAGILAGAAVLFTAGLIDDLRTLRPSVKLVAQFAGAAIAIAAGLRVELVENDVLAVAIALVWLVGITNAFNLLDNMDGLAASLAAVACAYFAIDAMTLHESTLVLVLASALGFACLGFLPFNLRPGDRAVVFMGDAGSQMLGFLLACLALASSWTVAGTTVATILLPLLVLAVPILDTTLVTLTRVAGGRPVSQGGKDHTSHRLVYSGLSETTAVGLLTVIAIAVGATALAYNVLDNGRVTTLGVLVTFVLLVQFGGYLADLDERTRSGQAASPSVRKALTFDPRRLVEVLVDFAIGCASLLAAYFLVVGGEGTNTQRGVFLASLPVVLAMRYVAFVVFRVYRRVWRFAGTRDLLAIVAGVALAEVAAVLFLLATRRTLGDFPARVYVVDALLAAALVAGSRLVLRLRPELERRREGEHRRIVIVGAGRAGRSLARELREEPAARVVGFLDDNEALRRRRLLGIPVAGGLAETPLAIAALRPQEVLVSIPEAPTARLDLVVQACGEAGVACRFVHRRTETRIAPVEVAAE